MAYLTINKTPTYVPQERLATMKREVAGDAFTYAQSMFDGKIGDEVEAKVAKKVEAEFTSNPKDFYENWVSLRLYGESAKQNIFWLLADFIEYTGTGRLIDLRDPTEQLTDSHAGTDYELPYGPYFVFEVDLQSGRFRKPANKLQIHIDVEAVDKIIGQFPTFRLYTTSFDAQFGPDIVVFPSL